MITCVLAEDYLWLLREGQRMVVQDTCCVICNDTIVLCHILYNIYGCALACCYDAMTGPTGCRLPQGGARRARARSRLRSSRPSATSPASPGAAAARSYTLYASYRRAIRRCYATHKAPLCLCATGYRPRPSGLHTTHTPAPIHIPRLHLQLIHNSHQHQRRPTTRWHPGPRV